MYDKRDFKKALKYVTNDDGQPYRTVEELREALHDCLANGIEYFPCGDCDNFDPKKGCRGHE